jgi:hypothetical protein
MRFVDAIPKGAPLYPALVNAVFQQFDQQVTDMDNGTHAFQNVDIDGGTIDAATIGATSPAPGSFTTIGATGTLDYGSVFKADKNGQINGGQNVDTLATDVIAFPREWLDSNGDFDTLTSRFTPSVGGWYMLVAQAHFAALATGKLFEVSIRKNGTAISVFGLVSTGTGSIAKPHAIIQQANGSTDYFDVTFYNGDTGAVSLLPTSCYFFGFRAFA